METTPMNLDAGRYLFSAVTSLIRHKPFLTAKASEMVLEGFLASARGASQGVTLSSRLTPREREILQLLAEGKSSKEAAAALSIGPKTAEAHRANILHKLNLHSVAELVRYAIRNKIVQP